MKNEIMKKLKQLKPRGAWNTAVRLYAIELLDQCEEKEELTEKVLLAGATDWKHYSYSGLSLCYDADIAVRVCTPKEFSRTKNGQNQPNKHESWLQVQARALYQAARLILSLKDNYRR